MSDQKFGCGSRRFDPCIGYEIEHILVPVMTDTDYNGQRELGHTGGKIIAVERCKIAHRAAATDNHDTVEIFHFRHHRIKGRNYA